MIIIVSTLVDIPLTVSINQLTFLISSIYLSRHSAYSFNLMKKLKIFFVSTLVDIPLTVSTMTVISS